MFYETSNYRITWSSIKWDCYDTDIASSRQQLNIVFNSVWLIKFSYLSIIWRAKTVPPHLDVATCHGFLPSRCYNKLPIMMHLNTYRRLKNRGLCYHSMYGHSLCLFIFFSIVVDVSKFEFSHSGIMSKMGRNEKKWRQSRFHEFLW